MLHVVAVAPPVRAPGEHAAAIARPQGPPQRRRDDTRLPARLHLAAGAVPQRHPATVAGQPARRFSWKARPVVQLRPAVRRRVGQDLGVHVHHHLHPVAGSAGRTLAQCPVGHLRQGVGLPLRHRRQSLGADRALGFLLLLPRDDLERPSQQGALLGREPPLHDQHAVLAPPRVQPAGLLLRPRQGVLGGRVGAAVGAHQALELRGRPIPSHGREVGVGLGPGDAGDGADLAVAELTPAQGGADDGQGGEGPGHADVLPGGAEVEAGAPRQPVGAGEEAGGGPGLAPVDLGQERQEAGHGGLDVSRQGGDLFL
ncbi:MAG: hypothetical protein MUC69_09570, partial [Gemmatimonadales bacterium]|nr:hypothetical protein [Gemmatimonadales bacterium]